MEKFDKKYKAIIPTYSGDYSPYWEDGAAATAKELAITKHTSERLNQSEILAAMLHPEKYDAETFYKAWREVVMFQEHTWGSWNIISDPYNPFTTSQWDYKKAFAANGEKLSLKILNDIIASANIPNRNYEVFNTGSWNRSDLIFLSKEQSLGKNGVLEKNNNPCLSQRLSDGGFVFLKDIPALGSKIYKLVNQSPGFVSDLKVHQNVMENEFLKVTINPENGSLKSIIRKDNHQELADNKQWGVNQ